MLEEYKRYLRADRKYAECFFEGNHLAEERGKGNTYDIYYIESVQEGDKDQDNAFEIFEDKNREDDM